MEASTYNLLTTLQAFIFISKDWQVPGKCCSSDSLVPWCSRASLLAAPGYVTDHLIKTSALTM